MIVGGVGAIGQGHLGHRAGNRKGLSDTGEAVADGLNKTTSAASGFFGFGSVPEEPKKEEVAVKRCIVGSSSCILANRRYDYFWRTTPLMASSSSDATFTRRLKSVPTYFSHMRFPMSFRLHS